MGCLIKIQIIGLSLNLLNEKLLASSHLFSLEAKWIWDNALLYHLTGCDLKQNTSSLSLIHSLSKWFRMHSLFQHCATTEDIPMS